MASTLLAWCAAFIGCLILQTTLVPVISIFGIQPDLLIMVLAFMSLKHGVIPGVYVGFLLGLGIDLYSPSLLGQHALAKTMIGFFMGFFNERVMRTDPIIKIIILLVAFFVHDTIFFIVEYHSNAFPLGRISADLLTRTSPRAAYTIIVTLLFIFWNTAVKPNLKR